MFYQVTVISEAQRAFKRAPGKGRCKDTMNLACRHEGSMVIYLFDARTGVRAT